MSGFKKMMWFAVVPLLVLIVAGLVLLGLGKRDLAILVTNFGTPLVLFVVIAYFVFFDSKKRWPGVSWQTRFGRTMTFYRG